MIHIILAILKIVGILLAVLLGLVLLILLTVLFFGLCGIAYVQKNHGELKKCTANVSVSWLFGILKVKAGYRNGQISFVPQIFGKNDRFR